MRPRHVIAFLVILAWQNAPIAAVRDEDTGRVRIGFGAGMYGLGFEEMVGSGGCEGPVTYRKAESHETIGSAGGMVEMRTARNVRVTASAGTFHGDPFGTVLLAWEGRRVGVGGGFGTGKSKFERSLGSPDAMVLTTGWTLPTAYLRLGEERGVHVRAELLPAGPTFGLTGWARVGVANGAGRLGTPAILAGMGLVNGWATLQDSVVRDIPAGFLQATTRSRGGREWQLLFHASAHSIGLGTTLSGLW